MTVQHLAHSHAHAGNLPGTLNLHAEEGDDTAYGNALYPVPAEDPNDPLQWPTYKKNIILIICSVYSFLAVAAILGPAVYIEIFAEQFEISPTEASGLLSYPNLAGGFGVFLLVPLYLKFGRRPIMLLSLVMFLGGLIGSSLATTFNGLMVARVIMSFGASICEALPIQLVNDIYYLNERGKRLGYYTICLCWGSTGPLYAGYMLLAGYSWRLFFYVLTAFAGALFIAAFLFVEESTYKRYVKPAMPQSDGEKEMDHVEVVTLIPPRKTFLQTLNVWSGIDHDAEFFMTMVRSFSYYLVPSVLWVITSFGIYIGLAGLAFNYTFPLKIVEPPYNWSQVNSGLIAVGNIVAYALAIPLTSTSDRLAAWLTLRNNGVREAEMRLGVMLPAAIIGPAGLVLYGLTAERNLHWIGYFIGVAMVDWSSYFFYTFALAYAIDSGSANTSEMLIAMVMGKQAISTGLAVNLLDWILASGYARVIAGAFVAVLLANNLMVPIFMWKGKAIRRFLAGTPLARIHKQTATISEAP